MNETVDDAEETNVRRALASLPNPQRQVLSLQYLANLDDVEVSEALGISLRAVRKHTARGRAVLQARLHAAPP